MSTPMRISFPRQENEIDLDTWEPHAYDTQPEDNDMPMEMPRSRSPPSSRHDRKSSSSKKRRRGDSDNRTRRRKGWSCSNDLKNAYQAQECMTSDDEGLTLSMEREGCSFWQGWCSQRCFSDGHLVSLEKMIEFMETTVIPQEIQRSRRICNLPHIPVSRLESNVMPVLRLWRKQLGIDSHEGNSLSENRLFSASMTPPLSAFSSSATTIATMPIAPAKDHPEAAISASADPTLLQNGRLCLQSSLDAVNSIAVVLNSLNCEATPRLSENDVNDNSKVEALFTELQRNQGEARGLKGTLYDPLLITVLQGHVQVVRTLSEHLASNAIEILRTGESTEQTIAPEVAHPPQATPVDTQTKSNSESTLHSLPAVRIKGGGDNYALSTTNVVLASTHSTTALDRTLPVHSTTSTTTGLPSRDTRLSHAAAQAADSEQNSPQLGLNQSWPLLVSESAQNETARNGSPQSIPISRTNRSMSVSPALSSTAESRISSELAMSLVRANARLPRLAQPQSSQQPPNDVSSLSKQVMLQAGTNTRATTTRLPHDAIQPPQVSTLQPRSTTTLLATGIRAAATASSTAVVGGTLGTRAEKMPSPAAAAASKGVPTISSTALNLQSRQGATSVPASPNAKPSIAQSTEPSNLSAGQSRKAPRVLSNNSIPVAGPVSMVRLSAVALSPANLGHTSAASVTEISTPPATPKASTVSTIPTTTTVQVPIGPTTPTQSIKNKPAPALPSPSITSLPLQTMETLPTEYRLNCDIHTVNDVWREWTVGLGGGPSIKSLNERFELSWLHPEDQEQYMELRSLVLEVERLMTRKGVKESLDLLEHARVMSAVDIHVFMETLRMRGLQGVKDLIQKQMVEQVGVKA